VKKFIYQDAPLFHNVEVKFIPGANPDLLLMNKENQVVQRIDLAGHDREWCNDILKKKGFYKKASEEEEVPEKYKNGPYREEADQEKQEL